MRLREQYGRGGGKTASHCSRRSSIEHSACASWAYTSPRQSAFQQDAGGPSAPPWLSTERWQLLKEGGSGFSRGVPSERLAMLQWVDMVKTHYIRGWNPQRINRKIFPFLNDQVSPEGADFKALGYGVDVRLGLGDLNSTDCTNAAGGKLYVLQPGVLWFCKAGHEPGGFGLLCKCVTTELHPHLRQGTC